MRFVLIFFPIFLYGEASFITQMEYASLLYKNPRGIGCNKCHGLKGEGKLIAKYKVTKRVKKGEKVITLKRQKEFRAPAINHLAYRRFHDVLGEKLKGMPKYYLTEGEIKALYFYLQKVNLEEKKK